MYIRYGLQHVHACHAEPIVEAWPVTLDYVHSADTRRFNIASSKRLNVVITPAAFRSIGDVRSFIILMNKPTSKGTSLSGVPARIMHRWLEGTRGKMSTLYRFVVSLLLFWTSGRNTSIFWDLVSTLGYAHCIHA